MEVRGGRAGRLEPLRSLERAPGWEELAARSANVFGTHEFLATWWRHFGRGRRLRAYGVQDEEHRLVGLLPLYEWRSRPMRILRFLGHGGGDQLGPVADEAARPAVAAALRELLADAHSPLLIGELLPGNAGWNGLLGGRRMTIEGNPLLRFDHGSWDDYVAAQSANLRQQIRRLERRLAKRHEVRYISPATAEEFHTRLDTLFALHRARWSDAASSFSHREAFHREFAALAWDRGWARLWLLEVDGSPAAAWYGLRFAGAECYYQMGRDPSWDRASVGFVLLVHSIREALRDGLAEYRFLRGGESYKYRFASHDAGLESILVGRGAAGLAMVTAARPVITLRRALRDSRR